MPVGHDSPEGRMTGAPFIDRTQLHAIYPDIRLQLVTFMSNHEYLSKWHMVQERSTFYIFQASDVWFLI
jgi:hypothetical protein